MDQNRCQQAANGYEPQPAGYGVSTMLKNIFVVDEKTATGGCALMLNYLFVLLPCIVLLCVIGT